MERSELDELLDLAIRPAGISVQTYPERLVLRFPEAPGLHRYTIPSMAAVGAVFAGLLVYANIAWGLPEPLFSAVFFFASLGPFVGAGVGALLQFLWMTVRMRMVRQVELTGHRIVLFSLLGDELWRGSVHELKDVWVAHDALGAVVGVRARQIEGFRVHGYEQARWLGRLLQLWRLRHAREGADPDLDRMRSLGERASQVT